MTKAWENLLYILSLCKTSLKAGRFIDRYPLKHIWKLKIRTLAEKIQSCNTQTCDICWESLRIYCSIWRAANSNTFLIHPYPRMYIFITKSNEQILKIILLLMEKGKSHVDLACRDKSCWLYEEQGNVYFNINGSWPRWAGFLTWIQPAPAAPTHIRTTTDTPHSAAESVKGNKNFVWGLLSLLNSWHLDTMGGDTKNTEQNSIEVVFANALSCPNPVIFHTT